MQQSQAGAVSAVEQTAMRKPSKGKKFKRASVLRREIQKLLPILRSPAANQLGGGLETRIMSERGHQEKESLLHEDILMSEEQEPLRKNRRTLPDLKNWHQLKDSMDKENSLMVLR